ARKSDAVRSRAAVHVRKGAAAVKKPATQAAASGGEPQAEKPKAQRPTPPAAREPIRATPPAAATARSGAAPAGPESDDVEAAEPGSLLAGPRNVQPYIVKRGEQYMSKEQLDHFRNILNSWKRDLMVEVDRTVSHMKDEAANFPDPNDRATQEEEFSLELRTRDRERKLIRKIDDALKRIDDGSYGYCLETGEEIGIKRLEARPVATLSIEAQERRERRERQYGDRDDRYR
ncbi:MAG TPA: RNA polymerase-binding protein DksA, partial [Steroidobacteraceae bacterium]|nr:RNA polymerase-binding protein DksA [Steroidobacteraceae bacterium]